MKSEVPAFRAVVVRKPGFLNRLPPFETVTLLAERVVPVAR